MQTRKTFRPAYESRTHHKPPFRSAITHQYTSCRMADYTPQLNPVSCSRYASGQWVGMRHNVRTKSDNTHVQSRGTCHQSRRTGFATSWRHFLCHLRPHAALFARCRASDEVRCTSIWHVAVLQQCVQHPCKTAILPRTNDPSKRSTLTLQGQRNKPGILAYGFVSGSSTAEPAHEGGQMYKACC